MLNESQELSMVSPELPQVYAHLAGMIADSLAGRARKSRRPNWIAIYDADWPNILEGTHECYLLMSRLDYKGAPYKRLGRPPSTCL